MGKLHINLKENGIVSLMVSLKASYDCKDSIDLGVTASFQDSNFRGTGNNFGISVGYSKKEHISLKFFKTYKHFLNTNMTFGVSSHFGWKKLI